MVWVLHVAQKPQGENLVTFLWNHLEVRCLGGSDVTGDKAVPAVMRWQLCSASLQDQEWQSHWPWTEVSKTLSLDRSFLLSNWFAQAFYLSSRKLMNSGENRSLNIIIDSATPMIYALVDLERENRAFKVGHQMLWHERNPLFRSEHSPCQTDSTMTLKAIHFNLPTSVSPWFDIWTDFCWLWRPQVFLFGTVFCSIRLGEV